MKSHVSREVVVLFAVTLLIFTGCGKSVGNDEEIVVEQTRTRICPLCHGSTSCYHCDGEGYRNGRRCSVCNGSGKCNYCNGVGSQEVFTINGKDYTICGSCHKTGKCGACNGTGRYSATFSTLGSIDSDCMVCKGSGKCMNCKGTGYTELAPF